MNAYRAILISGAGRGIGRVLATHFARHSDLHLILLARTLSDLQETARIADITQERATLIACDAADELQVQAIRIPEHVPPPDILLHNAGSYLYKPLAHTDIRTFKAQLDVNLFTAFNLTKRFLPGILEHGRGMVIAIDSVAALKGQADSGAYSASKHALFGYMRSLRQELKPQGIPVSCIHLGQTFSTSWDGTSVDANDLIDPEDLARLILTLTRLSPRSVVEELVIQPAKGDVPPM